MNPIFVCRYSKNLYMNIFKRIILFCTVAAAIMACGKNGLDEELNVVLNIPETLLVDSGDMEVSFRIVGGNPPLASDKIEFTGTSGTVACGISSITDRYVYVVLPDGFKNGEYEVYVSRGSQRKLLGETSIFINDAGSGMEIEEGTTVYGFVTCDGEGVPDVVVSDGMEVVTTDENGFYQIASEKKNKTVFVSVPSGYEPETEGIVPKFYGVLSGDANNLEQMSFRLTKSDVTDYVLLVFGDMHLANRPNTSDAVQFRRFTDDVNEYMSANSGKKIYALTLGDMTWDLYWTDYGYDILKYIEYMNSLLEHNLTVYHTIGNHDHHETAVGDFLKTSDYRNNLGPTYYSFNIGEYHYVVLDDIDFMDNIADRDNYVEDVASDQLEWLARDLAAVPEDTPVILAMHAPVYNDNSLTPGTRLKNASELLSILEGRKVHIFTGHTHRSMTVDKLGAASSGHFEHNAGAVCADWWWSYQESGILVSTDGAPGGYSIVDVSGKDIRWRYKPTDFSEKLQFRTYDLNNVKITYEDYVPNATESYKSDFQKYVSAYPGSSANEVLLNIWNWDQDWKLSVTENDKTLEPVRVVAYDPLHIIAYTAKRLNKNANATFATSRSNHFFKVKASSPTSTLEITVTDRFGNTYKETMQRPKNFTIETYKNESD